ncbi:MAG: translation initiation factor IF-2 [Fusobacteria bacterium]|nr:translation initiation factor IF-2 [Fusobacteriota bacterium]
MGKRIYEVAKDKGVTNKEIMWIMEKLNIEVKSHMSVISDENVARLENYYKELKEKAHKEEEEKRVVQEKTKVVKTEPVEEKEKVIEEIVVKKPHTEKPAIVKKEIKEPIKKKPEVKKPLPNKGQIYKSNKMVSDNTDDRWKGNKRYKNKKRHEAPKPEISIKKLIIGEEIQVKDLAMRLNKGAGEIIKKLMGLGIMATLNQFIDFDTATLIANDFGIMDIEFKTLKRQTELSTIEDDPKTLKPRPPIITVMGHVDHGKTSLLDAIRKTNVIATEAGGITQHIGAYQVNYHGKKITFIDTPGHAAFTAMRARGAQITDISILVVAADDGVMPQTIEAINHSKAAKVPIIVAVNKIDKEGADPNRVMQQLTEHGLISEEWGGDTIFVPISAKKGENIDGLLEMIQLVAEVEDLKANPNRLAEGFVLEGRLDKEKGTITSMLVTKGTLKIGDMILAGETYGKVRAMQNDSGKNIKSAGPSTPVEILGLSTVAEAGDIFQAVKDEKLASYLADQRKIVRKEEKLKKSQTVSLENLFEKISEGNLKELNLIVKGDVHGSVEALCQSIRNIQTEEVKVNIIHEGVGAINETDVKLAMTSEALIIGFNVRPDTNSKKLAAEENVNITLYRVIYEVIDDIKKAISGLLAPEIKEVEQGTLEVRQVIKVPKIGLIAGCYVTDGKITSSSKIRVIRDGVIAHEGTIDSLKRFKDEVKEVAQGYECGLSLVDFNDIKEGDVVEAYVLESIARKLD